MRGIHLGNRPKDPWIARENRLSGIALQAARALFPGWMSQWRARSKLLALSRETRAFYR
jgi:hypothetical protein